MGMFPKALEIRSKEQAVQFECEHSWAAISISSRLNEWPHLSDNNRFGLLQLAFMDVSNPTRVSEVISHTQAEQILDFVDEAWDKVETFLIHCEAGLSRSPAVAAAIAYTRLGKGWDQHFFDNYTPNMLVYWAILKAYYGHGWWS
jgi:predicted protein tyrosine phosphatase